MKVTVETSRVLASDRAEITSAMVSICVWFTAMRVESRIVVRHRGIQPAGVEGKHSDKMMRSELACGVRRMPMVG